MRITDLLKSESIALGAQPKDKYDAIAILTGLMEKGGNLSDKAQYEKDVLAREASGTTGLGDGIATPHAKSAGVKAPGLAAMTVPAGMDFEAMDQKPSRLFFEIAAPDTAADVHLEVLSKLATMIMDPDFKETLIAAKSKEEFLSLIDAKEDGKFEAAAEPAPAAAEAGAQAAAPVESTAAPAAITKKILAVTACPTGIAHTFMAAESLEQHAKKRGIPIKVETNGSGGAKNILTAAEIAEAACIIVAADKNVEMARFDGKPVIQTKVANGINKADALLDEALSGTAPIYHHAGGAAAAEESAAEDESITRQIYKHLMNGVSHMLPFVIGGGILIALAFLLDTFDPANPGNFGSNLWYAKTFMDIGGISFGFMLPVLAGFIAMSIADRPGLAVGFVGGALASSSGAGFLGALIAGFVAGYVVNALKKVFADLPHSLEGIKPVLLYPLLGVFLVGVIMIFVINPPVAGINNWMIETLKGMDTSSRIFIGVLMGGMMAVDMGGPVNKAAYVVGTGMLVSGEYGIMAAVMAGGMVPPIAIALATTFFKSRFTEQQRKSGVVNYIMGLSFITEGAIPFAAADPLRVIPSCVIGSATAGGLSMFFDCTLRAPHGGIFVVPTIGNPLLYLVAIFAGAVLSALCLGIVKKKVEE
ncbi:PTS fructose transporter subunit IIABC [Selenomonas sputigena]|uniref:PTS system, fructose subfamily, IIC subunit n=1 Tax=Selenomonas sputigena (strain ATCC 35185 / DSM 20758 / CCUG 44933 / VPI D19B-28) TaxID=546271 RepID=C9LYU3_SELS3|nr:fructose-specific PTS transporter subunit EIIC [Selenomonas sputigena]AEC00940.1 PTS system, fructose subfamily, IIC subunit [Selenomonas sputigena ATCC 35185]EEX76043.1 phosphoenolpyruvate-dependent sugar phosphotransferase system, EIIA 2 [Selenomonas sputigena ATCC 35185]